MSINYNAGNVVLNGAAASFPAIAPLLENDGGFQLLGGQVFSTVAAYTNSGRTVVDRISALNIAGGLSNTGTIDVSNLLTIGDSTATPIPLIRSQLRTGYAGGFWNGIGIDSSAAAAAANDPNNLHRTAADTHWEASLASSAPAHSTASPSTVRRS